jgi:hypothetical protein
MKYFVCIFAFYALIAYSAEIPDEIVTKCKAGGGCVIMLESDLKALIEAAKKTCLKDTRWKS